MIIETPHVSMVFTSLCDEVSMNCRMNASGIIIKSPCILSTSFSRTCDAKVKLRNIVTLQTLEIRVEISIRQFKLERIKRNVIKFDGITWLAYLE